MRALSNLSNEGALFRQVNCKPLREALARFTACLRVSRFFRTPLLIYFFGTFALTLGNLRLWKGL